MKEMFPEAVEREVILALYLKSGSLHAHFPKEAFIKKIPPQLQKWASKGLDSLVRKGLVIKHPTSGDTTYQLSKDGQMRAKLLLGLP